MTTATLHSATPLSNSALFLSFSARLSERQRAALSELAAGRPILAAAASAGVHRSTLHGWLSHCEDFQAAYAALCRHQSESDSDLAAIARASLQALITDPATSAELRLRAIQTALKLVQSRPVSALFPALERSPDAPLPPPAESPQPVVQPPLPPAPLPAVARPGRGSSTWPQQLAERRRQSAGGTAEEGAPSPLPLTPVALAEPQGPWTPKPEATPVAKATVPRNASCPCGSKLKFKRCCGKNAPPVLHAAAS